MTIPSLGPVETNVDIVGRGVPTRPATEGRCKSRNIAPASLNALKTVVPPALVPNSDNVRRERSNRAKIRCNVSSLYRTLGGSWKGSIPFVRLGHFLEEQEMD
jgi:hypothetical protein